MLSHLSTFLIGRHQFGFQKQCSTITQLIECYFDWSSANSDGSSIDVIYLDYAKAFKGVVHSKLFLKLEAHGLTGNLLSWIKEFLSYRYHYESIYNSNSNIFFLLSGVPQSTVLGTTFFIIYVNTYAKCCSKGSETDFLC